MTFTLAFQIRYVIAAIVMFAIAARLTRARWRRIAGALCSVAVFTALSAPIDTLARHTGWWTYPSTSDPPHPPLPVYIGQALIFVGIFALIGWRVQRRFGARGVAVFAVVATLVGLARDFTVAAIIPGTIAWGDAPAAQLADLGAWGCVLIVALGVTRLVAGPASADP